MRTSSLILAISILVIAASSVVYWQRTRPAPAPTAVAVQQQSLKDPSADTDGDGLTNAQETKLGTNPLFVDSDSDGFSDGNEVQRGTDPLKAETGDANGNGILDSVEQALNIHPTAAEAQLDANNNGTPDVIEKALAGQQSPELFINNALTNQGK